MGRMEACMDVPGHPGHVSNMEKKGCKYGIERSAPSS